MSKNDDALRCAAAVERTVNTTKKLCGITGQAEPKNGSLHNAEQSIEHIRRLVAENEAQVAWKAKIIKAAEKVHGPAAFRFKLSLRKNGTATNVFPQWLDQRWVSFVYAEDDAHIGLHAKIEAQAALLRQAVEQMGQAHDESLDGRDFQARQILMDAIAAIRQHLEGRA